MVKTATITRIKTLTKQGYTTNQIQRKLQQEKIGVRRQTMLKYVREFRHKPLKARPYRYTPIRYRKSFMIPLGKQIAGYGTVHGIPRRIQTRGLGKELYQVMTLASKHPPKKQFLTIPAWKLISNLRKYLDFEETWDDHPEIKS